MKKLLLAALGCAAVQTASPAHAQSDIVLDYRDRPFRSAAPALSATEKASITTAIEGTSNEAVKALGKAPIALGMAKGRTPAFADVSFVLLSQARPTAAEPFPQAAAQVIVAMKGTEAVDFHVLPADRQYARLVGVVDLDEDMGSEVLLEGSGFNMGQLILSLDVVRLEKGGATSVAQSIPEVYADTCDNPVGAKGRSAKTIRLSHGKLVATVHQEKCG